MRSFPGTAVIIRDLKLRRSIYRQVVVYGHFTPELGRIKGAQYSMTGAVTEYYYKAAGGAIPIPGVGGIGGASNTAYVTLDIRIINNETGEVAYAAAEHF